MSKVKNDTLNVKLAKLDELMAWFEGEDFALEEAIDKFSQAKELVDEIEHDLMEMKNEITVLSERFDRE